MVAALASLIACRSPHAASRGAPRGSGCGRSLVPGTSSQSLDVRGTPRRYLLRVPGHYDARRAYPLVLAWHGAWSSAERAQARFGLDDAVGDDALVAYPVGLARSDDPADTGWDLAPDGADLAMVDAVVADVDARACLDRGRVFGFGASLGGYLASAAACGGRLRGVASVEAGPPDGACAAPVTAVVVHGVHDEVVPLSEGEASRDRWAEVDGCDARGAAVPGFPSCVALDGCRRPVWWCTHALVEDGGHVVPGWAARAAWAAFRATP